MADTAEILDPQELQIDDAALVAACKPEERQTMRAAPARRLPSATGC